MFRVFIVSALFLLLLSGCKPRAREYDKNPIRFAISNEFSQKEVAEIISTALINLKWNVDDIQEGKINASLNHRSWNAKITITFDKNGITILNQSLLLYATPTERRIGAQNKPVKSVPYNWLLNIKKAVENEGEKRLKIQKAKEQIK